MTGGKDFMALLPVEVSSTVLSFLDAKSLNDSSSVNETWNQIANYVMPKVWFDACRTAGFYVRRDDYRQVEGLKAFLSAVLERRKELETSGVLKSIKKLEDSAMLEQMKELEDSALLEQMKELEDSAMLEQMKDLKDSACFPTVPLNSWRSCGQVRTIYSHKENLGIAYKKGTVEIWSLPEKKRLRKFDCDFEPSDLKFDDEILVAAAGDGVMSSWIIASGEKKSYTYYNTTLKSFDFLTHCDILVGYFKAICPYSSGIYAWNLQNDIVCSQKIRTDRLQNNEIVRVLLAPHPDNKERATSCYLFSLAVNSVGVWEVEFEFDELYIQNKQLFNFPGVLNPLPVFKICKGPGLLFHGETFYVLPPTRSLAIWNPITKIVRCLEDDDRIINLLGIGEEHLVYEIRQEDCFERVIIANRNTDEITKINVPGTHSDDDDYLGLFNTWRDSMNGENDDGCIYVSIIDDEIGAWVTKFDPESERRRT